jgi:3'-5' exoribonuclease
MRYREGAGRRAFAEKGFRMKFIKDYSDGDRVFDIYLCKHKISAVTKNGKPYETVILQDKTGTIDAKIWDPNNAGIADFDTLDYIEVYGEVTSFQSSLQVNVKRIRKCQEGEYNPADYLPVSKYDIEEMYGQLMKFVDQVENGYLKRLLQEFFVKDEEFIRMFKSSSAAKTIHHGFVGGLLQHTLSVTRLCDYYCTAYPLLKRDLLITAAICHDMGKVKEISPFPANDYTDEGQFLGHIVMGVEMVGEKMRAISGFPRALENELKHCILAHHGEYEFGAPKKPAIMEAQALYFADNTDAKLQTLTEIMENTTETGWLGFNRLFDSNLILTRME